MIATESLEVSVGQRAIQAAVVLMIAAGRILRPGGAAQGEHRNDRGARTDSATV